MGNFKDLRNRIMYGVPLAAVAVACLAFNTSALIFIGLLATAFIYEVGRSIWKRMPLSGEVATISSAFMVLGCIGFLAAVMLRLQEDGFCALILIALGAVATDIFAYAGGKKYGRTPFFPNISPKKTWEGVIIGVAAGMLVFLGSWFAFYLEDWINLKPWSALLLVVILPIASVAGDLLESKTKRLLRIKDFSNVLGDHGGVADRLDSVMAAVVVYGAISQIAL